MSNNDDPNPIEAQRIGAANDLRRTALNLLEEAANLTKLAGGLDPKSREDEEALGALREALTGSRHRPEPYDTPLDPYDVPGVTAAGTCSCGAPIAVGRFLCPKCSSMAPLLGITTPGQRAAAKVVEQAPVAEHRAICNHDWRPEQSLIDASKAGRRCKNCGIFQMLQAGDWCIVTPIITCDTCDTHLERPGKCSRCQLAAEIVPDQVPNPLDLDAPKIPAFFGPALAAGPGAGCLRRDRHRPEEARDRNA